MASIMDPRRRYFINQLQDYDGGAVSTPSSEQLTRRVLEYVRAISTKWDKTARNCDGGLYVGLAGAVYTYHRLAGVPQLASERNRLLDLARELLSLITRSLSRDRLDLTAFILGNAGAYAVAAVVHKELGNMEESKAYLNKYTSLAPMLGPARNATDVHEFLVGRAGYLAGVLWLRAKLDRKILDDAQLFPILDKMVESGHDYGKACGYCVPLMYQYYQTEYLGAAHGVSGILVMLLCFPEWLSSRPESKTLIKKSVDGLLTLQQPNGNFPASMDEVFESQGRRQRDELVHWCHGAPGFVYLLAKAHMVYGDQKYLEAALRCGEVTWEKGLLTKGPGICHGVAGSGYVFLTLYRLTQDPKHLHRAIQFYNFIYMEEFKQARTPDCPYSLFEGVGGTACFVADLMNPVQSSFPLFDIF